MPRGRPKKYDDGVSREKRYSERMREKGFTSTMVWVPADRVGELRQFAEQLRNEAEARSTPEQGAAA